MAFPSIGLHTLSPMKLHSILLLALLAVPSLLTSCRPQPKALKIAWDASDHSAPVPRNFCYLFFPHGTSANLSLDRAVICAHDELTSGGKISVFDDHNVEFKVDLKDLSTEPDGKDLPRLIQNLNNTLKHWGAETDWKEVRLEYALLPHNSQTASVYIDNKDGNTTRYDYKVENGKFKPQKMWMTPRMQ